MSEEHVFNLLSADIKAATDDNIFCAVKESHAIILLDLEQITRVEKPVLVERLGRNIGTLEISGNDISAPCKTTRQYHLPA